MHERLQMVLAGVVGSIIGLGLFLGGGWYVNSIHQAQHAVKTAQALKAEVRALHHELVSMPHVLAVTVTVPVSVAGGAKEPSPRHPTTTVSPSTSLPGGICDTGCGPGVPTTLRVQPRPCTPPSAPPGAVCGPATSVLSSVPLPTIGIQAGAVLATQGIPPRVWIPQAVAVMLLVGLVAYFAWFVRRYE